MYKLRIFIFLLIYFVNSSVFARNWYNEHKVIAVYIYNLLEYTTWPDKGSKVICVTTNDKVNSVLRKISKQYSFSVKVVDSNSSYNDCYILYIDEKTTLYNNILKMADKNSVLTVSANRNFIDNGGIVGIVYINDKTSLEVNYKKAKSVGLEISADLLEVAQRVIK